jgi:hypothetical protein
VQRPTPRAPSEESRADACGLRQIYEDESSAVFDFDNTVISLLAFGWPRKRQLAASPSATSSSGASQNSAYGGQRFPAKRSCRIQPISFVVMTTTT